MKWGREHGGESGANGELEPQVIPMGEKLERKEAPRKRNLGRPRRTRGLGRMVWTCGGTKEERMGVEEEVGTGNRCHSETGGF